jgi:hypothetical protein
VGFLIGGTAGSAPSTGANGGSLSGGCGATLSVLVDFRGMPGGTQLDSTWTRDGGATGGFSGPPTVEGGGRARIGHPAQAGGLYRVTVTGGGASASGSVSFTC